MRMTTPDLWQQQLSRLMARNGWGLVSCAALWQHIVAARPTGIHSADELTYIARGCYGALLYRACCAGDDPARQNQAFHEIHQYLFRLAKKQRPAVAEEAAQQALVAIHAKRARCEKPEAFHQFIYFELRSVLRAMDRKLPLATQVLDSDITDLAESAAVDRTATLSAEQLAFWECMEAALHRLANVQMRTVVIGTYHWGWTNEEIAAELGIADGYVNVLRHRALAKLRTDQELRKCIQPD